MTVDKPLTGEFICSIGTGVSILSTFTKKCKVKKRGAVCLSYAHYERQPEKDLFKLIEGSYPEAKPKDKAKPKSMGIKYPVVAIK